MTPAVLVVVVVLAYLAIGVVFAVPFVLVGVGRLDPVARGAPVRVRLLLLPGSAALWPLMAARVIRVRSKTESQNEGSVSGEDS